MRTSFKALAGMESSKLGKDQKAVGFRGRGSSSTSDVQTVTSNYIIKKN